MANRITIISQNVEILCKTSCKSLRKSTAKLCEKLPMPHFPVQIHPLSPTFAQLSHRPLAPVFINSFPLLHRPYYNYY